MRREKRLRRVVSYIPHAMFAQLEMFVEQESNVISMSDYLHDVIEQHLQLVRISKQKIGRRSAYS